MSTDTPQAAPTERTEASSPLWIAIPTCLFLLKVVRWWVDVSRGKVVPSNMSTWSWYLVIFEHVAVIGGAIALIVSHRERSKSPGA